MPLLLAVLALLISLAALTIDGAHLWSARQELQAAADAAALAAVQSLAHDDLLCPKPQSMARQAAYARAEAQRLAQLNYCAGQPVELLGNDDQQPTGDIVFGFFEPCTRQFLPARPEELDWPVLNAVRVTARRTHERGNAVHLFFSGWLRRSGADLAAEAVATLDHYIAGFQSVPRTNIPLMPIALLSDPTERSAGSWEVQVERALCESADPPTMVVCLSLAPEIEDEVQGIWVRLGAEQLDDWTRQIQHGLGPTDLRPWHGRLIIPDTEPLRLPADVNPPARSKVEVLRLHEALQALRHSQQPARAWPLFTSWAPDLEGGGTARVTRFVAARLLESELDFQAGCLRLHLQPCQIVTTTAVPLCPEELSETAPFNPYIAKPRLIK
jgi:hypothetical protein